jgi:hypothetical protein
MVDGIAPRLHDLTFAARSGVLNRVVTAERSTNVLLEGMVGDVSSFESAGFRAPWGGPICHRLASYFAATLGPELISYQAVAQPGCWRESDAAIAQRVDDMRATWRALSATGVTVPKVVEVPGHQVAQALRQALYATDGRVYIRAARSSGGSSVRLVRGHEDADAAVRMLGGASALLTKPVGDGRTINVHGFVGRDGAPCRLAIAVQLVGLASLHAHPTQYCGSDFVAAHSLEARLVQRIDRCLCAVGHWLGSIGYLGIFGVDFAFDTGVPIVLDVNPRLQASTWLVTEKAFLSSMPCPGMAHLAALRGMPAGVQPLKPDFGYLVVRTQTGQRRTRLVRTGAYHFDGSHVWWSRHAVGPADLTRGEVFVDSADAVPMLPGATEMRIVTPWSVTDDGGLSLNGKASALIADILVPARASHLNTTDSSHPRRG